MHDLILLNLSGRSSCCSRSLPVTPRSSVAQSQRPRCLDDFHVTWVWKHKMFSVMFNQSWVNPSTFLPNEGSMTRSRYIHILNLNGFFTRNLTHQFWPGKHWSDRYREPRRDFQERLKDAYAPLPGPELEAGGGNRSIGWLQPGVFRCAF